MQTNGHDTGTQQQGHDSMVSSHEYIISNTGVSDFTNQNLLTRNVSI